MFHMGGAKVYHVHVSVQKGFRHVIYGLVGLKTHSKITLVVRKEEDGIRRYAFKIFGRLWCIILFTQVFKAFNFIKL